MGDGVMTTQREAKFTKGPWFVDQYGHVYGWEEDSGNILKDACERKSVCLVDGRHSAATMDDKILIAAAPEMYEALDVVAHRVPVMASEGEYRRGQEDALAVCRETALAALAKARGESEL